MDTEVAFKYEPLIEGQIRLLHLSPWQSGQDLSGTLERVPFHAPSKGDASKNYCQNDPISYEAVSWSWGLDKSKQSTLIINKGTLKISASLDSMLRQFALPDRPRTLWVDAICINQDDKEEKTDQIKRMGAIYRMATRVLIYLGPEADDSQLAIDMVENVAQYAEYLDESTSLPGRSGYSLALEKGFRPPASDDHRRWSAWRAFWRRPWFRRVWIIQEFVFATDIAMFCGGRALDWYQLKLAAGAFVNNNHLIYVGYRPWRGSRLREAFRAPHENAIAFESVVKLRMRSWGFMTMPYILLALSERSEARKELEEKGIVPGLLQTRPDSGFWRTYEGMVREKIVKSQREGEPVPYGRRWDLLELLIRTRNFMATEPVDRIYGLLGLANEDGEADFEPRYLQTTEETVMVASRHFAATWIRRGRCQEVLALAGIYDEEVQAVEPTAIKIGDWLDSWLSVIRRAWLIITMAPDTEAHNRGLMVGTTPEIAAILKKFPSWVPAWIGVTYAQSKTMGFCLVAAHWQRAGVDDEPDKDARQQPLYNAALDSTPDYVIDETSSTLRLMGRRFDVIAAVLPAQLRMSPQWYESIASPIISPYSTGESAEEVMWRTLIANRTSDGEAVPAEFAAEYAYLKRLDRGMVTLGFLSVFVTVGLATPIAIAVLGRVSSWGFMAKTCVCLAPTFLGFSDWWLLLTTVMLQRLLPSYSLVLAFWIIAFRLARRNPLKFMELVFLLSPSSAVIRNFLRPPVECAAYMKSMVMTVAKYNLCLTVERRLALVPRSAKAGDQLVVFHGCAAPFVIRPSPEDESFRLVGEAYVHGVMHGEVMREGRFKDEQILLR